jgi:hypothetical protein
MESLLNDLEAYWRTSPGAIADALASRDLDAWEAELLDPKSADHILDAWNGRTR